MKFPSLTASLDRLRLDRAARWLGQRVDSLEKRIQEGEEEAWEPYQEALRTLAALLPHLGPQTGALLTTAEMAARLGITSKTLLRHKAEGRIRPTVAHGKLLRWSGKEALDGNENGNTKGK